MFQRLDPLPRVHRLPRLIHNGKEERGGGRVLKRIRSSVAVPVPPPSVQTTTKRRRLSHDNGREENKAHKEREESKGCDDKETKRTKETKERQEAQEFIARNLKIRRALVHILREVRLSPRGFGFGFERVSCFSRVSCSSRVSF